MATKSAFAKARAATVLLRRSSPSMKILSSSAATTGRAGGASDPSSNSNSNSSIVNSKRFFGFYATVPKLEKKIMKVPTMGDSITEVCQSTICRQQERHSCHFNALRALVIICKIYIYSLIQGTIVEWTVEIGQAVSDGDVVALVETDKVTVEIKAQVNGVITQRFGAV
jgi:acetyl/propionyl-CoA carboxylase alpha subunit